MGAHGTENGSNLVDLAAWRQRRSGEAMIHGEIRALYAYWEALRAGRPCPDRHEIDPREMPADARHVFLLEQLGEGNVRFRLAGSALNEALGFDLGGMSLRAIMEGPSRESVVALVAEALAEPGVGYARLLEPDGASLWEMLLLPLRGPDGAIDRVLGCLRPVRGEVRPAGDLPLRFTIESMVLEPVAPPGGAAPAADDAGAPVPGFAEAQAPFRPPHLRPIAGGAGSGRPDGAPRPALRVVRGGGSDSDGGTGGGTGGDAG